jgi:Ser/Thr protein kinase RdoA (MazF antagonist)
VSDGGVPAEELSGFHQLDPDTLIDAVEAAGLRCNGRFLALASYENRVYQLGVEDARPVVAKFYRPGRWSDATIIEEHDFSRELAEAELPVVAPLRNVEGASLLRHGPYRFALYPSIGGRAPYLDNAAELEQLGRLLGRVHAIGATAAFRHRPVLSIERLGTAAVESVGRAAAIPDDLVEPYRTVAEQLIERTRERFDAVRSQPSIRLHGDCHSGNVLVRDGGPWLVDFDDACTGPAIQDLWMFLSGDRDYMQACLQNLLRGYVLFCDFDRRQLGLIEPLRALRMLHYSAWLTARREDPAFIRAFPWFYERTYWGQQILTLREQLARLDEPVLEWR